jgi:hypothetical protein
MSRYVEILFRHRLRFLILLVILPAELALLCLVMFPHQTAVSSMWVDNPAYISVPAGATGWNQYMTPAQNTVDAMNQLRGTDFFVTALGRKLDASNSFKDAVERASVLQTVTGDVVVAYSGSHLVTLTYTCQRDALCKNVLTGTEELYHEWLAAKEASQAKVATDFYAGQLTDAKARLISDGKVLDSYVSAHPNLAKATSGPQLPSYDAEYDQLLTNVAIDKGAVASLQQKLDDTTLAHAAIGQLDTTVFRVIDQPRTVSSLSALPRKQIAIAVITALAVGVGVLMLMAWSDRTTRDLRELENILRLPVVTVPDLSLQEAASG